MVFLTSFLKNGEIRPLLSYKIRGKKSPQLLEGTSLDLF